MFKAGSCRKHCKGPFINFPGHSEENLVDLFTLELLTLANSWEIAISPKMGTTGLEWGQASKDTLRVSMLRVHSSQENCMK